MENLHLNETTEYALSMLKDDFTELWLVTEKILEKNPDLSIAQLAKETSLVIKEINKSHKVKIIDENNEMEVLLPEDQMLEKIKNHIVSLNKIPNIGDGLWLSV